MKGVSSASWDVNTKKISVGFNDNKVKAEDIQRAIAKAGHDTELFRADDATYKSLPECCLYR